MPAAPTVLSDFGANLIRYSAIHQLQSGITSLERLPEAKALMATLKPDQFLELGIQHPWHRRNIRCFVGFENIDNGHRPTLFEGIVQGIAVGLTRNGVRFKINFQDENRTSPFAGPTRIVKKWRSLVGILVDRGVTTEHVKERLFHFTALLDTALKNVGIRDKYRLK